MKRVAPFATLCLLLWMGVTTPLRGQTALTTVTLATGEWVPITGEHLPGNGLACEITQQAFAAVGVSAQFRFYPWKRCELMLDNQEIMGLIPYSKTEERLKKYLFSDGMLAERTMFFYLKDNVPVLKYEKYEELRKYRIAGIYGYWYEKEFAEMGANVFYVNNDEQLINMLLAKRIDLIVLGKTNGWYLLRTKYPAELARFGATEFDLPSSRLSDEQLASSLIVLKTHPQAQEIIRRFNDGLKKIKATGAYQAILAKYGQR